VESHPALPSLPPFVLPRRLLQGGVVEQEADVIPSVSGRGRGREGGRAVVSLAVRGRTEGVAVDGLPERISRIEEEADVVVSVHFIVPDARFPHHQAVATKPPGLGLVLVLAEGVEGDGGTGGKEDDLLSALGREVRRFFLCEAVPPEDGIVFTLALQDFLDALLEVLVWEEKYCCKYLFILFIYLFIYLFNHRLLPLLPPTLPPSLPTILSRVRTSSSMSCSACVARTYPPRKKEGGREGGRVSA